MAMSSSRRSTTPRVGPPPLRTSPRGSGTEVATLVGAPRPPFVIDDGVPALDHPRDVVEAFFARLGVEADIDGWLALLDDGITVDTPFSPVGDARRFEGLASVERRFAAARRRMRSLTFLD